MSQLKLIKLVYIAYGWVLALTGRRLFEEPIQAWKHGPVIPSIYHEFKHFGREPIEGKSTSFDLDTFDFTVPSISKSDKEIRSILDKVWSAYKMFSGWSLRQKTHQSGTPWRQTYEDGVPNKIIPDSLIAPHFRKRISEILDAAERG